MRPYFVIGLPRSGTTWLARTVAESHKLVYVHEPDHLTGELLGWAATRRLGPFPVLDPGERAGAYRALWRVAFSGGWPDRRDVRALRRLARVRRIPVGVRGSIEAAAAYVASAARTRAPAVLVKSVRAQFALEWLGREFDPRFVVVWRHPINLVPAWLERAWNAAAPVAANRAVRRRFMGTSAWPPPSGAGTEGSGWAACAQLVILLETAAAHSDWLVVSHEQQCVDPLAGFRSIFERLALPEPPALSSVLAESDRTGSGYEIRRRASDEPGRWKTRLSAEDQRIVFDVVARFAATSPVAEAVWATSPALSSAGRE